MGNQLIHMADGWGDGDAERRVEPQGAIRALHAPRLSVRDARRLEPSELPTLVQHPGRPYGAVACARRLSRTGAAWHPEVACRALILVAMVILAAFALIGPAWATTDARRAEAETPRRVAFVVGNSEYRNITALANPRRDAQAIAGALERVGFEVTKVIDGDQQTITRALSDFTERSRGSDIVLFFFAGHGVQINGENYLLPVSIETTDPEAILEQSLSLNQLRNQLRAADPGLAIVILDSCRDNPFGPLATINAAETAAPLVFGKGLAQTQGAAGMLIAYATQPGELAYDGTGTHSPFTESLLRHFEETALEIRLMLGRVREDVVTKTGGKQVPWVEEAVLGEFYFSEPAAADGEQLAGKLADDDLIFWRSIWRSTKADDYKAYLGQFPEGTFAALASNRLAALSAPASDTPEGLAGGQTASTMTEEDWRLIKNSLYWLGYYNGPLSGTTDEAVTGSIQAFQDTLHEAKSGRLTGPQRLQLHDAAADSLISLGERLAERVVFDQARLVSIDRGISDIAMPAYAELVERLSGSPDGEAILAEAKQQLDAMRQKRDTVSRYFERATQHYMTVVAAASSGYLEQVKAARTSIVRAGGTENANARFLGSRRQLFLKHALDYADNGGIDEKLWIAELR